MEEGGIFLGAEVVAIGSTTSEDVVATEVEAVVMAGAATVSTWPGPEGALRATKESTTTDLEGAVAEVISNRDRAGQTSAENSSSSANFPQRQTKLTGFAYTLLFRLMKQVVLR